MKKRAAKLDRFRSMLSKIFFILICLVNIHPSYSMQGYGLSINGQGLPGPSGSGGAPVGPPPLNQGPGDLGGTAIDMSGFFGRNTYYQDQYFNGQFENIQRLQEQGSQIRNHIEELKRAPRVIPPPPEVEPLPAPSGRMNLAALPDPTDLPYQFKSEVGEFRNEVERLYKDFHKVKFTRFKVEKDAGIFAAEQSDQAYSRGQLLEAQYYKELAKELLGFLSRATDQLTEYAQSAVESIKTYGKERFKELVVAVAENLRVQFHGSLEERLVLMNEALPHALVILSESRGGVPVEVPSNLSRAANLAVEESLTAKAVSKELGEAVHFNSKNVSNPATILSETTITIGRDPNQIYHAFRHIDRIGLDRSAVQEAILNDLKQVAAEIIPHNPPRQIKVNGNDIEYFPHRLPDGSINVGRIHGPK
jgi:hypothetical protein